MLYLYDPRYNLKTETTYEKMCRLFVKTKGTLQSYKSKNRKVNKRYYINYTTEKVEKEAFKFYRKQLKGSYQHGIEVFVKDWKDSGLDCTSFAKLVMKEGKMYNQMNKK